jgi:hypothetical protein
LILKKAMELKQEKLAKNSKETPWQMPISMVYLKHNKQQQRKQNDWQNAKRKQRLERCGR